MPRAEQVAADVAIDEQHERRLRLPIRVVSREVVREKLAVLENGIDRVAQKPRLAAQLPNPRSVRGLEFPNLETLFVGHWRGA